jgi:Holliday junction DNA helicase RuvA
MIEYVDGTLASSSPTHLVVEVGGVGMMLNIPLSSFDTSVDIGDRVQMFTHLHVREDILALYGFVTVAERSLFRLLIGVSGIGPPLAQKILSGMSLTDFAEFLEAGDAKGLTRIKGIGQKTAQRLILELKDLISDIGIAEREGPVVGESGSPVAEATEALVGLGASPVQAKKVVEQVAARGDLSVEEIIKEALRNI